MMLWVHQLTEADGSLSSGGWSYVRTECREPQTATPGGRALTWLDVLSALRRVGLPTAEVKGPAFTLVNLNTTFYTTSPSLDRTLQILSFTVHVKATATSYTWHWGDGTTTTTQAPGAPYPSTDITHTYTHHTEPGHDQSLSVSFTYSATYQVDGGAWQTIPDTITVPGPTTSIPVRQASAVLVGQGQ